MKRASFVTYLFAALCLSARVAAETPVSVVQYLTEAPTMSFTGGGAVQLPPQLIQAMRNGQVSEYWRLLLLRQMMTSCAADVLKHTPSRLIAYMPALQLHQYAVCRVYQCMKQGILLGLSFNSANAKASASPESMAKGVARGMDQRRAAAAEADPLAAAASAGFQNGDSCEKGSPGVNAALLSGAP